MYSELKGKISPDQSGEKQAHGNYSKTNECKIGGDSTEDVSTWKGGGDSKRSPMALLVMCEDASREALTTG